MSHWQWGRFDDRLAAAQTPREAALLLALKGESLARLGRPGEARQEIDRARRALADRGDATATCAILTAEALALQQEGEPGPGRQALARAVAIARSAGVAEQLAYSQAWVAQFEANAGRLHESLQALSAALGQLAPDNLRAKARLAMVIASWAAAGGDLERARLWCDGARAHATREGDTAMQAGVLARMAAIWTDETRVRECLDLGTPLPTEQAMRLVRSAINFDDVLGSQTLGWLGPLMLGALHLRLGSHVAALPLLELGQAQAEETKLAPIEACVLADIATCLLRAGRRREAQEAALHAEAVLHLATQGEDRVVTLTRLAEVFAALGLADKGERHARQAAEARQSLCTQRAAICEALDDLLQRAGLETPWALPVAAGACE